MCSGKVVVSQEKDLATKRLSASASKRSHLYTSAVCYCCNGLQSADVSFTRGGRLSNKTALRVRDVFSRARWRIIDAVGHKSDVKGRL